VSRKSYLSRTLGSTGTIGGTITAGQVGFGSGVNVLTSSPNLTYVGGTLTSVDNSIAARAIRIGASGGGDPTAINILSSAVTAGNTITLPPVNPTGAVGAISLLQASNGNPVGWSYLNNPGIVQRVFLTLTSAQLLALLITPVQILPAPGVNFIYNVVNGLFHYRFNTTAYTLGGMGSIFITYPAASTVALAAVAQTGLVDQANDAFEQAFCGSETPASSANALDQPLTVNTDTAMTLGDGTLTIQCDYVVIDSTRLT